VALPYCYPLQLMEDFTKAEKADVAETLKPEAVGSVRNHSTTTTPSPTASPHSFSHHATT
jgi:hypothetical protein